MSKIVLAAGGTGGHLFPAESVARILIARGHTVALLTDGRGAGFKDKLPGVETIVLPAKSPSGGILSAARGGAALIKGVFIARGELKRLAPDMVVGFGGYASVPATLAAQSLGIATMLHEQNAVLGRANRLLAGRARLLATGFAAIEGAPMGVPTVAVGNPVRADFQPSAYAAPDGDIRILVTGGSQGAKFLSETVPAALALLPDTLKSRLSVVQQTREESLKPANAIYAAAGIKAELLPFFYDMPKRLADCHLLIGRAGAMTCAEAVAVGRPAMLVPLPHAMDDHQSANAKRLADAGAAWIAPQGEMSAAILAKKLEAILSDSAGLVRAAAASTALRPADPAAALADRVLALVASPQRPAPARPPALKL